jgi:hypothetical protein
MSITCFISHAWADGEHDFALSLADALQAHGIERAWIDEREIPGGGHIGDRIAAGIRSCDVFLFVMSPNALASRWCRIELQEALVQRSENGIQIIPLLLKDCSIPSELESLLYIDLRNVMKFQKALDKLLVSIREAYLIRVTVQQVLGSDSDTRSEAAQRLFTLKNRFTVPILSRRLDPHVEYDPVVRRWLAEALGQIGGEEACAALRKAQAKETHPFVRLGIVKSLHNAECQGPI